VQVVVWCVHFLDLLARSSSGSIDTAAFGVRSNFHHLPFWLE